MNEQDMKVFGGFGGFRVLFFAPGIRKELSRQILQVLKYILFFVCRNYFEI